MAAQFKCFTTHLTFGQCTTKPMFPFSSINFTSPKKAPLFNSPCSLKQSSPRFVELGTWFAVWIEVFQLWFLKKVLWNQVLVELVYSDSLIWSWLWEVGDVKILVDPILVGNLDFGIPWLYDAAKKVLKNFQLDNLPQIDCLLITQSLDDHCHLRTLKPLSQKYPGLRVIATPNAKPLLDPLFSNVTYLEPGEESEIDVINSSPVKLRATAGPVLGPPWQRPENGYLVSSAQGELTLYYEPHCVYNKNFLEQERADIVITPVIKQLLPKFTLVSGQEDAVQLAKLLNARFIVPMKNGDLDAKGFLASIIRAEGTIESFKEILLKELPDAKVLEPTPGVPLDIPKP
ncbi:uncharacterized protein [Coffea arabica]|uniref:Uncharacterized protein isoform X2 n=1 Tax=Coffea arabica TaxID=13443 RepID=A0ABM4W5C3_COFAR